MCVFFRIFVCELKEEKAPICRAQKYKEILINAKKIGYIYKKHTQFLFVTSQGITFRGARQIQLTSCGP